MKYKKIISAVMAVSLVGSCVLSGQAFVSADYSIGFAGESEDAVDASPEEEEKPTEEPIIFTADGGFTVEQIAASPVKPKITASRKVLDINEIPEDRVVSIDINVSGADKKYASTRMHIYFDERLTFDNIKCGEAATSLGVNGVCDKSAPEGWNGAFACTAGSSDEGLDGTYVTINVIIPSDVKKGDVYPIDILYKSIVSFEDIFRGVDGGDEKNSLMQAYAWTQGIYNPDYNCNFKASEEDIAKCHALADIAGYVDGYIAIADNSTKPKVTTTVKETTLVETTNKTTKPGGIIPPPERQTTTRNTLRKAGLVVSTTTTPTETTLEITYGDANCDGKISIADATAILQHLGNEDKYGLSDQGKRNADVDGKKGVTGNDAITIQMVDAKMLTVEDLPLKK